MELLELLLNKQVDIQRIVDICSNSDYHDERVEYNEFLMGSYTKYRLSKKEWNLITDSLKERGIIK